MRRTKASLIYRRTRNLRAVQLLLGHTKLESTVRYFGIEVDDALEMAEQTEVQLPNDRRAGACQPGAVVQNWTTYARSRRETDMRRVAVTDHLNPHALAVISDPPYRAFSKYALILPVRGDD
jgi:hypothetical protein